MLRAVFVLLFLASTVSAAGTYHEVSYPPSKAKGELVYGVTYTVWIPHGVKTIRGVIVHQHGCGAGACKGGETAAYDLHWQALAKKWDCALLGPSYHQEDKADCRLWCDPRNGSAKTFLRSLTDLAKKSGHPELEHAPWCLWGHSGGGFWASILQTMYPDRIIAIWCRSGTAIQAWEKGEIPEVTITDAVYGIPVMMNPGVKERDDKRFRGAWTGAMRMFQAYREKGAPIGFAPDPRTAHECGDSRYLAIPYFDACLELRLPKTGVKLKPIDLSSGWLATPLGDQAVPVGKYSGAKNEAVWLPNEKVAKVWSEYVKTGSTVDTTPPPAPTNVLVAISSTGAVITWNAEADFESGIRNFIILQNGKEVASLPAKPVGRFGRPLFQSMSYHDTPSAPLPKMSLVLPAGQGKFQVVTVNSAGLKSPPSK